MNASLVRAGNWERVVFARDYQHEIANMTDLVSPSKTTKKIFFHPIFRLYGCIIEFSLCLSLGNMVFTV